MAHDLILAGITLKTERMFLAFIVVWAIGAILLYPFRRLKGGERGNPSTGSEKTIVGVTWFLLALATGIYLAQDSVQAVG